MIRLSLRTAAAALAALVMTRGAAASPPSAVTRTVPPCIALVGTNGGVVDAAGQFVVIVRGLTNNPLANMPVTLDFSACSGVTVGGPSGPVFPGVTVDCANHTVTAISNALGVATFRIAGAGITGAPGPTAASVRVTAWGVPLMPTSVRICDLDGVNGMDAADLSIWLQAFLHPGGSDRSELDYDCSGALTAADLSMWLTLDLAGGSSSSAAPCSP